VSKPVLLARHHNLGVVSVEAGDSGDVMVVWGDSRPGVLRQYVQRRSPGGVWAEPYRFVVDGDGGGECTSVAVDRRGTATLVYNDAAGFYSSRLMAIRQSRSGTWSGPELLAEGTHLHDCLSDVDADGRVAVAWADNRPDDVSSATVVQATSWNGRSWAPVTDLSAVDGFNTPALVSVDTSGTTTVVWGEYGLHSVSTAHRPRGGGWSRVEMVPAPAGTPMFMDAAADDAGDVAVAWSTHNDAWLVRRHAGSTAWSAPALVSDSRFAAAFPQVALDGQGRATMVWEFGPRRPHGYKVMQTSRLPFAAPRVDAARIDHAGTRLVLRLSEDARVTLSWRRTGSDDVVATRKLWLDAGRSTVPLRERMGGQTLAPGRHVLEVDARNVMGVAALERLVLRIAG
jgi:hypothetical protein